MVSMIKLLYWFFTPIKLYSSGEKDTTSTTEKDFESDFDKDFSDVYGGNQVNDSTRDKATSEAVRDYNQDQERKASYAAYVDKALGGALSNLQEDQFKSFFGLDPGTKLSTELGSGRYTFDAFQMQESVDLELDLSHLNLANALELDYNPNLIDYDYASLLEEAKKEPLDDRISTVDPTTGKMTTQFSNHLGGMDVMTIEYGVIDEMNYYSTSMDGSVIDHTTTVGIGNSSISYDTHYWGINNTQFGFMAEITADALEVAGVNQQTVRQTARAVEVAGVMLGFLQVAPIFTTGLKMLQYSKTFGTLLSLAGAIDIYDTLSMLENFQDKPGDIRAGTMPDLGGSERSGDLGEVIQESENSDYIPFLLSANNLKFSSMALPPSHTQKQLTQVTKEDIMGQPQQAVFIDYRGGLSEVLDPHLIGANEGSKFTNIDITTAVLNSKLKGTQGALFSNNYFVVLPNDYIFSDSNPFSMVKLGNFMYVTSENPSYNSVYQLDYQSLTGDATVTDLVEIQVTTPTSKPNINADGADIDEDIWEEYIYAYTYYDEDTGYESDPIFSDVFLRKTLNLDVTNIGYSAQTNIDKIRLYRLGGYSQVYRLVTEIDNSATTGTTTFLDPITEEFNPVILDTQNLGLVQDLKGLTEHKGTMFGFKNNQVYFTRPGKPNTWSELNMVRIGGTVSGIASTPLGLLIFSDNSQTFLLGGTDKYNFTLTTISKTVGCIDYKSIGNVKNTAIWLDYEGLVMSVGSAISNISKEKVDTSDIGDVYGNMVFNNTYYLFGSNYTLAIDFRYNVPSFSKIDSGILYMGYKDGEVVAKRNDGYLWNNLFKSGDELTLTYKAPMFVGSSFDRTKEFNAVDLVYKGTFTYNMYINYELVATGSLDSASLLSERIKLPTDSNEGLGLEFELIGTGTIKSFRYTFTNTES
jgi:hypothetical protein